MKTIKKAQMGSIMKPMATPMMESETMMMKKGGKVKKAQYGADMTAGTKKMKKGGTLKAVDKGKNPGLAKLPKGVRNKMGYAKKGSVVKKTVMKKMPGGGMVKSSMMKAGGKMHKMPDGTMMKNSKMKAGGKVKACKYGCN